jgi:hypothetical protein
VARVIYGTSSKLGSVVTQRPPGNGVSAEAEESPLLDSVTRKRLSLCVCVCVCNSEL